MKTDYTATTATQTARMIAFEFENGTDKDREMTYRTISAKSASSAVSIFLKRGVAGLGSGWTLTRQPSGWIVAANKSQKTLERKLVRLREVGYNRNANQSVN